MDGTEAFEQSSLFQTHDQMLISKSAGHVFVVLSTREASTAPKAPPTRRPSSCNRRCARCPRNGLIPSQSPPPPPLPLRAVALQALEINAPTASLLCPPGRTLTRAANTPCHHHPPRPHPRASSQGPFPPQFRPTDAPCAPCFQIHGPVSLRIQTGGLQKGPHSAYIRRCAREDCCSNGTAAKRPPQRCCSEHCDCGDHDALAR